MSKRGFTLIELLAVIVILAIIALIAVPVILNVIEKSKIGAAEQSAQGYIDAVEKQIVTNKVKNENLIEEGEYTKSQLDEKNVKIKGEITDAIVVIGAKGRVTQGRFCINGYSIDYDGKKATKNSEANYCNEIKSILNTCPYEENQVFIFDYTGEVQEFTTECDGNYKLEVWGARGGQGADGNTSNTSWNYGKGGYSYGTLALSENTKLYVYSGGMGVGVNGATVTSGSVVKGGFNGGGNAYHDGSEFGGSGGGASDIRIGTDSLYARVIVAGGGGASGEDNEAAGSGGGLQSVNADNNYIAYIYRAGTNGSFGQGANYVNTSESGGGGGGGFYGGGGGEGSGSGGGSGWIYTEANYNTWKANNSSDANNYLLTSNYYLTDANTIAGNQTFKAPNGSNETGHNSSGYVRITYLGK